MSVNLIAQLLFVMVVFSLARIFDFVDDLSCLRKFRLFHTGTLGFYACRW